MRKVVVLAFSGGLDTSFCAKYLAEEKGFKVIGVTVNTGGFDDDHKDKLVKRAESLGIDAFHFIDITSKFFDYGIKYLLFGNVLKNNVYPLSVSAERVFQATEIAHFAKKHHADAIAHGSTGAGNDQIRFDTVFQSVCPQIEILTPIRDLSLSREKEIEYLKGHGIKGEWDRALYSVNQGLWGTSVGGKETLTSRYSLPEEAYTMPKTMDDPVEISIEFERGIPVALNEKELASVEVIQSLNKLAGTYAIGRDIHIGDTIIGIKGRVGFEAPAAMVLIKAHHTLEKHTLTKQQLFLKDQISDWYGALMHEGKYLDPVMRNIEAFLDSSQLKVSGKVYVRLLPYHFQVIGIESENDLMNPSLGTYGEQNTAWTGEDVRGFTKIFTNQVKLYNSIHNEEV